MTNVIKFSLAAVVVAFAFSFAAIASAVSATAIYTPASGYLMVGSGMGDKAYQAPYVVAAQSALNICVPGTALVLDGKFGPLTKGKFMAFQAAQVPAIQIDGIIGPVTAASLAACSGGVVVTPPSTPPSTPSGGNDGDITDVNEVSSADSSAEEATTSEVFAFEAEIEGDVSIDRIDFYLDSTAAGSESNNADDYFQSAILLVDGDEVADLDVEDFDEDSYNEVDVVNGGSSTTDEYRLRFSGLDLDFSDGDEPEFTLAFETNNSIDTGDQTETWGVELLSDSIRFVDGRGFSSEEGAALEESFGIDSEEMGELTVSTSSDDIDASTIEVSDDDTTEKQAVFLFEIEEENGVDVTVNDLTVTVTTTGTTDEAVVVTDAYLFNGSEELASESVPTGGVVSFEDIGLDIDANETVELTVKLTFADVDDYNEGDTVTVAFTSIDDAEDANGNDEGDMTISGTPSGSVHTLRSVGIMVDGISKSAERTFVADDTGEFDQGTFIIVFEVTAFGGNVWIDSTTPAEDNSAPYVTTSTSYSITNPGNNGSVATLSATDGDYDEGTNGWKINDGDTAEFTLEVTATASADSSAQVILENIGYALTDADGTASYLLPDEAEFKTSSITLLAA